jgi:hypothetical protein
MSTIFLKLRGQSGFELSSNQGVQVNYTKDFALPTFSGILYAGDNKSFIDDFNSKTVTLAAVLSDYSVKTDVVQWSQVSGAVGSFSSTDTLQTSFTTAANNTVNVVLRATITRTTLGGVISVSDDLQIDSTPTEIASNVAIRNNFVLDTSSVYFNPSWIGSNDQSSGATDVIYWPVPSKNGGLPQNGTADYIGYKVQKFNKSFSRWDDVQTGVAEADTGSYTITDLTGLYRYLPIWSKFGRKIVGNSVKFLRPLRASTNFDGYGAFESLKPSFSHNMRTSELNATRSATTITNITTTDILKPNIYSLVNANASSTSVQRTLNTVTTASETDLHSSDAISHTLYSNSLSVIRNSGASIIDLGN